MFFRRIIHFVQYRFLFTRLRKDLDSLAISICILRIVQTIKTYLLKFQTSNRTRLALGNWSGKLVNSNSKGMSMKNCFSRTERRRILYAALLYWLAFFRWARMPDGRTKDVVLILMTIYSVVLFAIVGGIGTMRNRESRDRNRTDAEITR